MIDEKSGKKYFVNDKYWDWEELSVQMDNALARLESGDSSRLKYAMEWVDGQSVLDIGCQRGVYSYYQASKGRQVVGIDVDPLILEVAERKFSHPNLTFRHTGGNELDFPDSSFGCVMLMEVLEHTFHPRGLISEIHRVLKPGGSLIVSVPNAASYHTLARTLLLPVKSYFAKMESWPEFATDQRDHYFYWDAFTLYRLLNTQGFRYLDHRYVDNRKLVNILGRLLIPLRKMSTCFMIKVRKT